MSDSTLTRSCSDWSNGRDKWSYRHRLTVFGFSDGGYEITVRPQDMEEARKRFADNNYGEGRAPKPKRREERAARSQASIDSSRGRARSQVRRIVRQMRATHLLTLTTREKKTDIESLKASFAKFTRLYAKATGRRLAYLAVPERHPKNPDHVHLHLAVSSYLPVHLLRRLWYIALGGDGSERGSHTPGQVDMQRIKVRRVNRRSVTIGSYLSKYLTKDPVELFNKKRYFASRGALEGMTKHSQWLDCKPDDGLASLIDELLQRFPELDFAQRDFWLYRDPDLPGGISGLFFRHVPDDP